MGNAESLINDQKERHLTSLAVSGQCCSGKSTLCRILSKKLDWEHVDIGNEIRKLAELHGLDITCFGSIPDVLLRQIDKQIEDRIRTETKVIWDGRLACYLARDNVKAFKIYCIASLDVRAKRSARRDRTTFREAKTIVLRRDAEEARVFDRLYGLSNSFNPKWINLRVDTSSSSPEVLSNKIMNMLRNHFSIKG